jgi:hypothetical protein
MNILPNVAVMSVIGTASMLCGFFMTPSRSLFFIGVCVGATTMLVVYLAQWRRYHRVAGLYGLRSQDRQIYANISNSKTLAKVVVLTAGAALLALSIALGRAHTMSIVFGLLGGFMVSLSLLLWALLLRARIIYVKEHDVTEIN